MNWTEKYRPKRFEEIKGQKLAIEKIKNFIADFNLKKPKTKKAIALHGPPGTGKTSMVHALATEINSEIFELNASDLRNKEKLREILKPAIEQQSLKKNWKIILLDEVDGISATDRGGITELITLIELSPYPVILTANDIWKKQLSPLRKKLELLQLKEIDTQIIKEVLIDILRKEKVFVSHNIITDISVRAKGDIRAAINDLEAISGVEKPEISTDERNKEISIFNALKKIFKEQTTKETLEVFDSVNMAQDEILLWVEENIPEEYHGEELARAYDLLSKADVFRGRIYKQQYWRFLVYINILLSGGISASKKNIKTNFTTYKRPTRILKMWLNNQKTFHKKSIAQKYAKYVHIGEKRAMHEFPILKQILNSNPKITQELKLSEEEIGYLKN